MYKVLFCPDAQRIPIYIWTDEDIDSHEYMEENTGILEQAQNLASLPFAFHHVALMPDYHKGYGMPIGGVLATQGVVIPNAVGLDIGCGMAAVRTSLKTCHKDILKKIMGKIRASIPVGFSHHQQMQDSKWMPELKANGHQFKIVNQEYRSALRQVGTLGGGNHFIEIQKGSDGNIWFMIHSGSRNLGKKVADYYNDIAKDLNHSWHSMVPREWDLAFLPAETFHGEEYIAEMNYCLGFAMSNRSLMKERIKEAIIDAIKDVTFLEEYNIHHNYASLENHYGKNVWIHRKGATLARKDTIGLIPGSQGTKSYIVRGLGKKESFESCSHGAGRRMGRKEAQRTLSLEEEVQKMDEKGILHAMRGKDDLDEAPSAYKDIDEVMNNQKDLVEPIVELSPLAVVKG